MISEHILELPGGPSVAWEVSADHPLEDLLTKMLEWVGDGLRPIAFDVETTGLDFSNPEERLRWIQIGDDQEAWVIHPDHALVIKTILSQVQLPLAHNGLFDAAWLHHRAGVRAMTKVVGRMWDTQLMAFLLDPAKAHPGGPNSYRADDYPVINARVGLGLKALSVKHLGPGADRYELELTERYELPASGHGKVWAGIWNEIPDEDPLFIKYSGADVVITCRLYAKLLERMSRHETCELYPVEQRVQLEAWRIMRDGLCVDIQAAEEARETLLTYARARDAELVERYGLTNANSPQQVTELFVSLDAPLTLTTKSGAWSVDRNVLAGLSESKDSTIASAAKLIRQAKQSRRYAMAYADKLAQSGGILYPAIRTVGATTGRWTISNPPIQQWPKKPLDLGGGTKVSLRGLFIPKPGHQLVACDLNSIEVVVGAAVSGDPNLLAAVDGDLSRSISVYDDLADQLDVERSAAKTVFLAGQYGSGAGKMAVALGTDDLAEVKRMKAQAFGGAYCLDDECQRDYRHGMDDCWAEEHVAFDEGFYGGIRAFTKALTDADEEGTLNTRDGWPGVGNLFGRWVPAGVNGAGTPNWFPTFNHITQGSARDLLMRMLIQVADAGLRPWLTVHDEIIVEVPDAQALEAVGHLMAIMTSTEDPIIGLPIRAECDPPAVRWGG